MISLQKDRLQYRTGDLGDTVDRLELVSTDFLGHFTLLLLLQNQIFQWCFYLMRLFELLNAGDAQNFIEDFRRINL